MKTSMLYLVICISALCAAVYSDGHRDHDRKQKDYVSKVREGGKAIITAWPIYDNLTSGLPGTPTPRLKNSPLPGEEAEYEKSYLIIQCSKVITPSAEIEFSASGFTQEYIGEKDGFFVKSETMANILLDTKQFIPKLPIAEQTDKEWPFSIDENTILVNRMYWPFAYFFYPPTDGKETSRMENSHHGRKVKYEQKYNKDKDEWKTTAVIYDQWPWQNSPPEDALYWDEPKKELINQPSETAKVAYYKANTEEQIWKSDEWIWRRLIRKKYVDFNSYVTIIKDGTIILEATSEILSPGDADKKEKELIDKIKKELDEDKDKEHDKDKEDDKDKNKDHDKDNDKEHKDNDNKGKDDKPEQKPDKPDKKDK
jgi:hypothetical protein